MTKREQTTVDTLALKFDQFLAEDKAWKADVTARLDPLVEERLDRIILQKYGVKALKVLAWIVGLLASVGAAWRYLVSPNIK